MKRHFAVIGLGRFGYSVAKAVTTLHGKVLENLGVQRIIYPERDMAIRVAHSLIRPKILEQLELSQDYSIVEPPAPKDLVGKALQDNGLRSKYGMKLISIKRKMTTGKGFLIDSRNVNPLPKDVIEEGDVLVLIVSSQDPDKFDLK